MTDIQITDEHLMKLEITEDSVLLIRVPHEISNRTLIEATKNMRNYIQERTGIDSCVISVPNNVEVSLLDVESLIDLKSEIDAVIKKLSGG